MKLRIQPMGRLIDAPAGANLLAVLREHDIPISYSRTAGCWGTCRCKVIAGKLADAVEPGRFIDAGSGQHALACTSVPTGVGARTARRPCSGLGFGNGWVAGVGGYLYRQVSADDVGGSTVAGNRGRALAVGPIVKYQSKSGWFLTARYENQYDVRNRSDGGAYCVKTIVPF